MKKGLNKLSSATFTRDTYKVQDKKNLVNVNIFHIAFSFASLLTAYYTFKINCGELRNYLSFTVARNI